MNAIDRSIEGVGLDLRALRGEIGGLREEVRGEIAGVRGEMVEMRSVLGAELVDMRSNLLGFYRLVFLIVGVMAVALVSALAAALMTTGS